MSHKDAMEPVLWSEANDEACIVTVTPPSHVKHRDAVRSMVWGIGFAVAWNQRLRVGEPRRNRTSPSLNTVSPWSNLLPEGRQGYFYRRPSRSENSAPSVRSNPAESRLDSGTLEKCYGSLYCCLSPLGMRWRSVGRGLLHAIDGECVGGTSSDSLAPQSKLFTECREE